MTLMSERTEAGVVRSPSYYEGPSHHDGDVHIDHRFFAYRTDSGLVSGIDSTVVFAVERLRKEVWPYFKDFNCWMNSHGYYWPGVVGDFYSSETLELGDYTYYISIGNPHEFGKKYPYQYRMLRVIPERLIVVVQPVPENGGNGGISPGFHVHTLSEETGKTIVTNQMQHATRTQDQTEEQAVGVWRDASQDYVRFWSNSFIPNLRNLIYKCN